MGIRSITRHWAIAALCGTCACSGKSVNDVGDISHAGAPGAGSGSMQTMDGTNPDMMNGDLSMGGAASASMAGSSAMPMAGGSTMAEAPPPDAPSELVGTWRGYIENYTFSDQSDSIELTIADGALSGTLVEGDAPAIPPATDPEAYYPPGSGGISSKVGASPTDIPGFRFTLLTPSFKGQRLQFAIATRQVYDSWCALQTSYRIAEGQYSCAPYGGFSQMGEQCFVTDPMTGQSVDHNCAQLELCVRVSVCACTMSACVARMDTSGHFDLVVNGNHADGSVNGEVANGVRNVHLVKQ